MDQELPVKTFEWEIVPNPHVIILNTRNRLPYLQQVMLRDVRTLPHAGTRIFLKSLLAIDGIVEIYVDHYRISLMKATLFSWEELKPLIERFYLIWLDFKGDTYSCDYKDDLEKRIGTPEQFAEACHRTANAGLITNGERDRAIEKYQREWEHAS